MRIGILFLPLFIGKGGTVRFCAKLTHAMIQRGHECVIYHQGRGEGRTTYPLPESVTLYDLASGDATALEQARRHIQAANFDIVCYLGSGKPACWASVLLRDSGIPLLVSERVSPHTVETRMWNREGRLAHMAAADWIHLLSQDYLSSLPFFLQKRATASPNPASPPVAIDPNKENAPRKQVLTVARLYDQQKQLSLLIRAFAMLSDDFPEWDCSICGTGPSHGSYARMIADMHLEHRIKLFGHVDDVGNYLKAAHLFCLPSAYEGSPNALLEAQTYGLPSVGFTSCGGVNDILIDGENGILLQDMTADSLAAALRPLMENAALRRAMGTRAHELLYRYDEKAIFDQWETMLHRVAKEKKQTHLDSLLPVEYEKLAKDFRELINSLSPQGRAKNIQALLPQVRAIHTFKLGLTNNNDACTVRI